MLHVSGCHVYVHIKNYCAFLNRGTTNCFATCKRKQNYWYFSYAYRREVMIFSMDFGHSYKKIVHLFFGSNQMPRKSWLFSPWVRSCDRVSFFSDLIYTWVLFELLFVLRNWFYRWKPTSRQNNATHRERANAIKRASINRYIYFIHTQEFQWIRILNVNIIFQSCIGYHLIRIRFDQFRTMHEPPNDTPTHKHFKSHFITMKYKTH